MMATSYPTEPGVYLYDMTTGECTKLPDSLTATASLTTPAVTFTIQSPRVLSDFTRRCREVLALAYLSPCPGPAKYHGAELNPIPQYGPALKFVSHPAKAPESEVISAAGADCRPSSAPEYPYVWRVKTRLPERKGQRCRVLMRMKMNSCVVEFEDGARVVTSRNYVRKVKDATQIRKAHASAATPVLDRHVDSGGAILERPAQD
jgi:hypothetical protein